MKILFERRKLREDDLDTFRIRLSVERAKMSLEPVCDFCGGNPITWVYSSRVMSTGEHKPCWRWTACDPCIEAIDKNDWDTLMSRAVARLEPILGPVPTLVLQAAVAAALNDFVNYSNKQFGRGHYE